MALWHKSQCCQDDAQGMLSDDACFSRHETCKCSYVCSMTEKVVGELVFKLKLCTLDIVHKVHAMATVLNAPIDMQENVCKMCTTVRNEQHDKYELDEHSMGLIHGC